MYQIFSNEYGAEKLKKLFIYQIDNFIFTLILKRIVEPCIGFKNIRSLKMDLKILKCFRYILLTRN